MRRIKRPPCRYRDDVFQLRTLHGGAVDKGAGGHGRAIKGLK
jgi:hypothetical protein